MDSSRCDLSISIKFEVKNSKQKILTGVSTFSFYRLVRVLRVFKFFVWNFMKIQLIRKNFMNAPKTILTAFGWAIQGNIGPVKNEDRDIR